MWQLSTAAAQTAPSAATAMIATEQVSRTQLFCFFALLELVSLVFVCEAGTPLANCCANNKGGQAFLLSFDCSFSRLPGGGACLELSLAL